MKKLILLLLIVPIVSFGQTQRELELCLALQSRSFSSINEADDALEKVLSVTGLKKNFTLTPCDGIQNALALTVQGERYIFYDKDFLKSISSSRGFSNLAILAHEIGHHLNNHALDFALYYSGVIKPETKSVRRKQELEADEFAGFVMAKLGATLAEAQEPFYSISREEDDTYSTHPSRDKRLRAVEEGFKNGGGKIKNITSENKKVKEPEFSELEKKIKNDAKREFEFNKSDLTNYLWMCEMDDYLYSYPDFDSKFRLVEIKEGELVRIVKGTIDFEFWVKVYFKNKVGYINKTFFNTNAIEKPL